MPRCGDEIGPILIAVSVVLHSRSIRGGTLPFSRSERFGMPAVLVIAERVTYRLAQYSRGLTVVSESIFTLRPIGRVESSLTSLSDAPKQGREGAPAAWLVFDPAFRDGLRDLQVGDEVLVLTWLDRGQRDVLQVHPRDDLSQPVRGVFSTRSADRPNPIGIHRVEIVAQAGALRLQVHPLEALNNTPIVDIKPVLDRSSEM